MLRHDNVILTPHIGGATEETLLRGALMVAEEYPRFAAGEPLRTSPTARRSAREPSSILLAIDAGTGSCRAVMFDERGRQLSIGQREYSHAPVPGVPGSQQFDTEPTGRSSASASARRSRASGLRPQAIVGVSATSMREGMVCYDRTAARSGLARTSTHGPAPRLRS